MTRRKRIALLLVFGVVLISAAAAYIEFHFHLPEGNGPAGPAVSGKPFEHVWSERKVLMLGVGDSVTAGFGARHGYSYFDRLAATPVDEFEDMRGRALSRVLPNLTTRNLAVSGSNSLQHVQWVEEKLEKQPADVFGLVVITSGGNDIIHWYGRSKPQEGGHVRVDNRASRAVDRSLRKQAGAIIHNDRSTFPWRLPDIHRRHLRSVGRRRASGVGRPAGLA